MPQNQISWKSIWQFWSCSANYTDERTDWHGAAAWRLFATSLRTRRELQNLINWPVTGMEFGAFLTGAGPLTVWAGREFEGVWLQHMYHVRVRPTDINNAWLVLTSADIPISANRTPSIESDITNNRTGPLIVTCPLHVISTERYQSR
jgi:hypothetical protein